jgi:hypothetical protein
MNHQDAKIAKKSQRKEEKAKPTKTTATQLF